MVLLLSGLLPPSAAHAQTVINVNSASGLVNALTTVDSNPGTSYTINITQSVTLSAGTTLPVINSASTVTINGGNGITLDGGGVQRGIFVLSGTVALNNLTIQNAVAQGGAGGSGGGGGAGLGGALFVANGANVQVNNVQLVNNSANGGAGTASADNGGGGGGMGGNGGVLAGNTSGGAGGGGLGLGANGGAVASNGSAGIAVGAAGGGSGGGSGGTGGASGGGGGGGPTGNSGGGGGGIGGVAGGASANGGAGGFGGGGGSGYNSAGGAGGFGGGGGSAPAGSGINAGNGGFGGGGGGGWGGAGGSGGFGGGTGSVNFGGGGNGGGGAGLGGAIFVQSGGTLTVVGSLTVNGNAVAPGAGGTGGGFGAPNGGNGQAYGSGFFLQGSGTLTFAPGSNQTQTVSNSIADQTGSGGTGGNAGSWGLVANGAGTLALSGANTYTGGTSVTSGTLVIGSNSALGSGNLSLAAGTTLGFGSGNYTIANNISISGDPTFAPPANTTQTISGVISDGGSPGYIQMTGPGTLVLSNTNTYTGATTVSGGTLFVSGSIATSATTVTSGGTLAGTGTVGNVTVSSGGTFAPGPIGTPGQINVNGTLGFAAGAFYAVQVTPASASNAVVTGAASLAGTVQANFAAGSYLTRDYTILSAGSRSGAFAGLATSGLPVGITASLDYSTANAVTLDLVAGLTQSGGLTRNQQNVATSLNSYFNNGGALPPGFVPLFGLTGGNLGAALSELSGEAATGAQQGAFQMMTEFLGLMTDPFVDGRGGFGGGATGFAAEDEPLLPELASAYAAVFKAPPVKAAPIEQRWTLWGSAYGGANTTSGDPTGVGSHDLMAHTGGFAAGADYHVTPFTLLGFALAGGGTNWSLAQGLGSGRSDAFQAGVYGKTTSGPAYVAASFAYTEHWMSTDRLAFASDHLTTKFDAESYGGRVEAGYRYASPVVAVTPYGAVNSQAFVTPTYSETDLSGGGFGLTYAGHTATDTRGEAGARFDHAVALDATSLLMLRAKLAYAHDWISDPSLDAVFQALPGASFVVNGATPAHDSGLASAAAEVKFAGGLSLGAKFDGEFASRSQTYAGTATVQYTW